MTFNNFMDKQYNARPLLTSLVIVIYFLVIPIGSAILLAGWLAVTAIIYLGLIVFAITIEFIKLPVFEKEGEIVKKVAGLVALILFLIPGVMVAGTVMEIL